MRHFLLAAAVSIAALAAGSCVAPPEPPPPAPPAPVPEPVRPPAPTPAPAPALGWREAAVSPGTWTWRRDARGSIAMFGAPGADAELTLRCDLQRRRIYLSRRAAAPAGPVRLTVRTSSTLRQLDAVPVGGASPYVAVELDPRDALIDAIGFSRGRFAVEGGPGRVIAPAWPETLRVAEDCRG